MMLLGLPALLLLGFGGAYLYHADGSAGGRSIVSGLQSTVSATALGISPSQDDVSPSGKITESIIQKQQQEEAAAAVVARQDPDLPPPVAPALDDDALPPAVASASSPAPAPVAPKQVASTELPVIYAKPVAPKIEIKAPAAIAPIQSSPFASTGSGAEESVSAPVKKVTKSAGRIESEPTITPVAARPLNPGVVAGPETSYIGAVTSQPQPAPLQQVAALDPLKPAAVEHTVKKPAPRAVNVALPATQPADAEALKLITRGKQRLEIGDIAAARLLFELAASDGSAVAATEMGRSYDPIYFAELNVRGVQPDTQKAIEWYEKAMAAGDPAAAKDLEKLSVWMKQ